MAKGVENLCEGAWLEVGLWRPGWFMSGSGGWVRERWVRGDIDRSRIPKDGRPEHTHPTKWQRGADLKRVVREGRAAGGVWVRGCLSRVCGSQGGQDKSCMTEGVERYRR